MASQLQMSRIDHIWISTYGLKGLEIYVYVSFYVEVVIFKKYFLHMAELHKNALTYDVKSTCVLVTLFIFLPC